MSRAEYQRERKARLRAAGVCVTCGRPLPASAEYSRCLPCRQVHAQRCWERRNPGKNCHEITPPP